MFIESLKTIKCFSQGLVIFIFQNYFKRQEKWNVSSIKEYERNFDLIL